MNSNVHTFFTTMQNGPMAVKKYRRNFLKEQGLDGFEDITMNQVHGTEIAVIDDDYVNGSDCDGLITHRRAVALFCVGADCPPVLFFDPVSNSIGVTHCGRCGTFDRIAPKMIHVMMERYGSLPENILVSIGPGIGLCCYEVSQEMADQTRFNFGNNFVIGRNIDLQMINRKQLTDVGVKSSNIHVSRICTRCNSNFFSFRRMKMKVGSIKHNAGIIALR